MTGFIVTLETDHFSFEAHGETEEEANEAMGRALKSHGKLYNLRDDWADPWLGCFETREFVPGASYRDGERLDR